MSSEFSHEVSSRICKHMNEDHSDAVLLYAQVFGGVANATKAEMLKIDPMGMDLKARINEETLPLRIEFDHHLANSEDTHYTLIAMVKQAKSNQKLA